jgi:hypothetical protein
MAVVGTNTVSMGATSSFQAQMLATPSTTTSEGAVTLFDPFPQVGGVSYVQRVYGSGNAAWCYYTQTTINPTPASVDTTPNWTGSITAHEVLAVI